MTSLLVAFLGDIHASKRMELLIFKVALDGLTVMELARIFPMHEPEPLPEPGHEPVPEEEPELGHEPVPEEEPEPGHEPVPEDESEHGPDSSFVTMTVQ